MEDVGGDGGYNLPRMEDAGGDGEYNLFTKWWFYVVLFLAIYVFTVGVHLYFDYAQWCRERDQALEAEAQAMNSGSAAGGDSSSASDAATAGVRERKPN
mmetsp:Transcript_46011/g.127778  ORF Transcript_46011/g.127778 Transcript_46011/m.127778 type:complete len:99 (+) Transcript_46011:188-484(+)